MTKQAWVIVEGTKPIGVALSAEAMERWLDAHPAACAVKVPYPDVPYDWRDDPDEDDFDPDDGGEYP